MIKAIETHYNGYKFRSRTEARWAVLLDTMGIEYEYEKEGYVLPDGSCYLPDFWLPLYRSWIEVKGEYPTNEEIGKLRMLVEGATPLLDKSISGFFAIGVPGMDGIFLHEGVNKSQSGHICFPGSVAISTYAHQEWNTFLYGEPAYYDSRDFEQDKIAIRAAREAQFEHGVKGWIKNLFH